MNKIDKIISESINGFINEYVETHREPLVEMSRINTNEKNILAQMKTSVGG